MMLLVRYRFQLSVVLLLTVLHSLVYHSSQAPPLSAVLNTSTTASDTNTKLDSARISPSTEVVFMYDQYSVVYCLDMVHIIISCPPALILTPMSSSHSEPLYTEPGSP